MRASQLKALEVLPLLPLAALGLLQACVVASFVVLTFHNPIGLDTDGSFSARWHSELPVGNLQFTMFVGCAHLLALAALMFAEKRGYTGAPYRSGVWIAVGLSVLSAFWVFPINAVDVSYYIAWGRKFAILGLDPYASNLLGQLKDPIIRHFPTSWAHLTSVFGPVAILIFGALNLVSPPHNFSLLFTFKLAFAGFYFLFAGLIWKCLQKSSFSYPLSRFFGVFANPAVILCLIADAHLDSIFLAGLAAACLALQSRRPILCGLALASACCVRSVGLMAVPFVFAAIWRSTFRSAAVDRRLSHAWQFTMAFCGSWGLAYVVAKGGDLARIFKFAFIDDTYSFSIVPSLFRTMLGSFVAHGLAFERVNRIAADLSNLLFVLGTVGLILLAMKHSFRRRPLLMAFVAMIWLLVTRPYYREWYVLWIIPFGILSLQSGRAFLAMVVVITMSILLRISVVALETQLIVYSAIGFALHQAWRAYRTGRLNSLLQ